MDRRLLQPALGDAVEVGLDNITLRPYRVGDVDAMYKLDLICFDPIFRFSLGSMRRFAEARGAATLLADASGQLAGFVIVQMEEQVAYVVTLDVAPAWRGQGLAVRLMADAEQRTNTAGATSIELHVFVGNAVAVRFYERIGYRRIATVPGFYSRGMDAYVYAKQLISRP